MAHRLIGIDTDGTTWRIAVLQAEKGRTRLLGVAALPENAGEGVATALAELPGGPPQLGDRICLALPARRGWLRQLHFPFGERRAVAAALPLELAAQLPLPLEECEVASLDPLAAAGGATVLAAAARRDELRTLLAPFESAGVPVQVVDLLPFAATTGGSALAWEAPWLVLCGERETLLLRQDGRLRGWQTIPHPDGCPAPLLAQRLQQHLGALRYGAEGAAETLQVGGTGGAELCLALQAAGYPATASRPLLDGQPLAAAELVPVLLALRAGRPGANFRRGAFAPRGEWAPLRRQLWLAAALLVLIVTTTVAAGVLDYRHRVRRAEALKGELTRLYRELVPGQGAVVDPLLQLQGKMVELERTARLGGGGREHAPLAVLQELSRLTPGDLTVEIRDFAWTPDEARLEGTAASFDAAGRFARLLEGSPLFAKAQLTDTRALAEGGRVEFRLTLPFPRLQEERR